MPTYGLSSTGFLAKPNAQSVTDLEGDFQNVFGQGINVSPKSVFGQVIGIMADRLTDIWQLAQAVYSAMNPDAATGVQFDSIAALTGCTRELAAPSIVADVVIAGVAGTAVPGTFQISTGGGQPDFLIDAPTSIPGGGLVARGASTHYATNSLVLGSNGQSVWYTAEGGLTSNQFFNPLAVGPATVTDGAVLWQWAGGVPSGRPGAVLANFTATVNGAIPAAVGTMGSIATPVSGIDSVFNTQAAVLGRTIETDGAERIRREETIGIQGETNLQKIVAAIVDLQGVTSCSGFENTGDVTDAFGVPPHSIEIVVIGGSAQEIAQQIYNLKAGGIGTYGIGGSEVVSDNEGNAHTIEFTIPAIVDVYVDVTLTSNQFFAPPAQFPNDGGSQVKNALAAYGAQYLTNGSAVVASQLAAVPFGFNGADEVPGVVDVTLLTLGTAPSPAGTVNLAFNRRQIPTILAANCLVNGI